MVVDTTVQEKVIAFPTDAGPYQKASEAMVREAKKSGVRLRQSYVRVGKQRLFKQQCQARAQQFKRAAKEHQHRQRIRIKEHSGRNGRRHLQFSKQRRAKFFCDDCVV